MNTYYRKAAAVALAVLGYEWIVGGVEKIRGGFAAGLAPTLARFAEKNPFSRVAAWLREDATANAEVLGHTVAWGEALAGVAMLAAAVILLTGWRRGGRVRRFAAWAVCAALVGGMLMNAAFFLAAGHTSPSTHGVNMVMFWVQAGLLYALWPRRGEQALA